VGDGQCGIDAMGTSTWLTSMLLGVNVVRIDVADVDVAHVDVADMDLVNVVTWGPLMQLLGLDVAG